jgi:hypothetical protein
LLKKSKTGEPQQVNQDSSQRLKIFLHLTTYLKQGCKTMKEITTQLDLLPKFLRSEVTVAAGETAGLSPQELAERYRTTADAMVVKKRASYVPSMLDHEEAKAPTPSKADIEKIAAFNLPLNNHPVTNQIRTSLMYYVLKYLATFSKNIFAIETNLKHQANLARAAEAARQQAVAQEKLRIQGEAARKIAQREAAEAARLAAELAARRLAHEQTELVMKALAQRKAEEAALQDMRTVLWATPVKPDELPGSIQKHSSARPIGFMPGPAAIAEIERATLLMKHSIDNAVEQYALAITPYLKTPEMPEAAAH